MCVKATGTILIFISMNTTALLVIRCWHEGLSGGGGGELAVGNLLLIIAHVYHDTLNIL